MKKISVWMLALMLVPGLMLVGCKKEEPAEETPATTEMETTMEPMTTEMAPMSTDMGTMSTDMGTEMATSTPPVQ